MKVFLSILFSLLVLVCATSQAWVYIAFKLNQSYIAAVLCENRFEPLVLCSGSCYLDQQLEALDGKDQPSSPAPQLDTKDFHFPSVLEEGEAHSIAVVSPNSFSSTTWQSSSYSSSLFKPPQLFLLS